MKWASRKFKEKQVRMGGWQEPPSIGDPFDSEDAKALERAIAGNVVLPTDPNYNRNRMVANFAFQRFPTLIAYCEVFNDVRYCIEFAKKHKLQIAVRSGGHSTAGLSVNDGMVIDLSRMCHAVVDPFAKTAKVGAGTNFEHLDACLDAYRLHVPGAGCADVCVAGFMQGGGYGYTSRNFGLNCDSVESITVMLADGRIVVASSTVNPDLFWALRGGMGGNLAIILEITYRLHDLGELWGFRVEWPLEPSPENLDNAANAMAVMQSRYMLDGVDGKFGYKAFIGWQAGVLCVVMRGMYNGSREEGLKLLEPLLRTPGAKLTIDTVGSYRNLQKTLVYDSPTLPDVPDLAREEKESRFIARPLSAHEWREIMVKFRETPNQSSLLGMEPYGGMINQVGATDTAFIHRDAYMNSYLDVFWMSEDKREEALRFLDGFMVFMKSYSNGESCQTYPRPGQKNYRQMYWGAAFQKLLAVKQKYDPEDLFSHEMAITPEPGGRQPILKVVEGIQCEVWSTRLGRD